MTAVAVVPAYGQCGGSGWTGAAAPSSTATTASSTRATTSTAKPSTTAAPSNTPAPPAGITTTLPASAGYTALPTASIITGSFDGHMVKFDRKGSSGDCEEQTETGEEDAVFILESGASISNVIIGKAQAEGIHCRGPCTVTNVWWEDVCEDAITIKQTGAGDVSTINGGGAFHAEDKIGKLYRACGNCATSHERHVQVDNVCLKDGKEGTGINSNWGDTAILTNIKTSSKPSAANVCCAYKGVAKGSEPPKIGW
ncbi:hypothetical protein PC9H_002419 [Pleurotus ostreatus]|uniref:Pectate lyase n=1 Tax=Pleurotus ostreatus TaxID=5322 RepID=A0A8H7DKG1_PLEOS|nr:uncharacterized protein PC9H_002419 [Pleurotus ostreatus]KAF7416156.1 hypothetical protein PC9H_002419 [Pleurotus ostreatus]